MYFLLFTKGKIICIIILNNFVYGDNLMGVRKIKVTQKQDVLVPARAVEKLMDISDGAAALTYLYIISHDGDFDDAAAASRLKLSADRLAECLAILCKNGLIETGDECCKVLECADTIPEFTAGDVSSAVKEDSSFRYLLDYTQKRLGKVLSTVDTQTLLGIYSWMGLPVDVICLIITSCIDETRKKYGESRKPTMRAIEQRARLWLNLGIMTQAQAEEYLKEQEKRGTRLAQISRLLHLGGRPLSATEARYLTDWVALDISDDLILKAYDITVVKTGSLKWKYMDSIIKSWHAKGFKTPADVDAGEKLRGEKAAAPQPDELASVLELRKINRKRRGEAQ